MPICINLNFDTCKISCEVMDASDTCEQLSYTLFEKDALLIVREPCEHLGPDGPFFYHQLSFPMPQQLSSSHTPSSCVGLYPSEAVCMQS